MRELIALTFLIGILNACQNTQTFDYNQAPGNRLQNLQALENSGTYPALAFTEMKLETY